MVMAGVCRPGMRIARGFVFAMLRMRAGFGDVIGQRVGFGRRQVAAAQKHGQDHEEVHHSTHGAALARFPMPVIPAKAGTFGRGGLGDLG